MRHQVVLGVLYNVSQDYDSAIEAFEKALKHGDRQHDYSLWNKVGRRSSRHTQCLSAYDCSSRHTRVYQPVLTPLLFLCTVSAGCHACQQPEERGGTAGLPPRARHQAQVRTGMAQHGYVIYTYYHGRLRMGWTEVVAC